MGTTHWVGHLKGVWGCKGGCISARWQALQPPPCPSASRDKMHLCPVLICVYALSPPIVVCGCPVLICVYVLSSPIVVCGCPVLVCVYALSPPIVVCGCPVLICVYVLSSPIVVCSCPVLICVYALSPPIVVHGCPVLTCVYVLSPPIVVCGCPFTCHLCLSPRPKLGRRCTCPSSCWVTWSSPWTPRSVKLGKGGERV